MGQTLGYKVVLICEVVFRLQLDNVWEQHLKVKYEL